MPRIDQLINPRHGKRVLWIGFVQVCEVYTHSPLPILLLYYHCISQPFRVEYLFDSPSLLKLVHFFLNNIRMLFR